MNPLRHNVIPLEFVPLGCIETCHDERRNPEQDVIDEIDEWSIGSYASPTVAVAMSGARCVVVTGMVCQVNTDV